MSAETRTTLQGYFTTGAKPTQTQFENLVDSNLNLTDGGVVTGGVTFNGNYTSKVAVKTISVATAADASHTLAVDDAGVVLITAALENASVIKLPAANATNAVGTYYKIIFAATMAGAASIELPDGGTGNFVGCIEINRCGSSGAGVADAAAVNRIAIVPGSSKQSIELDENNKTYGGGIGSILEIYYASTTEVVVTGHLNVNLATTGVDAAASTSFTANGYS
tara:strand:+ start:41 stop:709 length:669 start_codon:yes stop_codon:yes gene_type:complete